MTATSASLDWRGIGKREKKNNKKWQRKTAVAYTLIKGGKGEVKRKASGYPCRLLHTLSQGQPYRAVHGACRHADVEAVAFGKSGQQKNQQIEVLD